VAAGEGGGKLTTVKGERFSSDKKRMLLIHQRKPIPEKEEEAALPHLFKRETPETKSNHYREKEEGALPRLGGGGGGGG